MVDGKGDDRMTIVMSESVSGVEINKEDAASEIANALISDYYAFYRKVDCKIYFYYEKFINNDDIFRNLISKYCRSFYYKLESGDIRNFTPTIKFQNEIIAKIYEKNSKDECDINPSNLILMKNCTFDISSMITLRNDPSNHLTNQWNISLYSSFDDEYSEFIKTCDILEIL
jgi:hypothetical protein